MSGRPKGTGKPHAAELGIPYRKLLRLGGEARLRAMSDDARAVLLKPGAYGSTGVHVGGLIARGMAYRTKGYVTRVA